MNNERLTSFVSIYLIFDHILKSFFFSFFSIFRFRVWRSHNMLTHLQTLMRCTSDKIATASQTIKSTSAATVSSSIDDDTITPCSGRGDCLNGTCLCEIRYSGDECDNYNLPYHASKFSNLILNLYPIPWWICLI